ncbi:hypothetical protein Zmor_015187 [Zophobas morio]|uniref:EF-hand domain-containing protein n=1 Tax=Zophobas morio TaxID=2755281 RepID=A0AA38IIY6_9CUCU|nr:hypothetical protein Zmor_015187 [Zophobas morio]
MKNCSENSTANEKMKFAHNCKHVILLLRWSYTVPLLCYFIFFLTIWMLSVPLKPIKIVKEIPIHKPEDTFEIRMKNSNFNSDRKDGENNLLNNKNEYLINVNANENANKDQTEILQEVFKRADKDKNYKLDSKELAEWIRKKIVEHISSAVSNNYALFTMIDVNPRNGVITWKEYHTYFLKKRGFSKKYVENHDEKRHKGLQRSIKGKYFRVNTIIKLDFAFGIIISY